MPLTDVRNPEILKNHCLYCERTVDNPCYKEDPDNKSANICPLRPMEYRDEIKAKKAAGHCNFCFSDDGNCNLVNIGDTSDTISKKNYCPMRPLGKRFPIIISDKRERVMQYIRDCKPFFMQHGNNIVFMSGINAEGSYASIEGGSRAIMRLVNPIGGFEEAREYEDIGGSSVSLTGANEGDNQPRKRGRPSKQQVKENARQKLAEEGLIEEAQPKRKRGRPRKEDKDISSSTDTIIPKKRGRPRKNPEEVKTEQEKKENTSNRVKKSPGNVTSSLMSRILKI